MTQVKPVSSTGYGYSEVYPWNDCAHKNYHGFKHPDWAEDTARLSGHSTNAHFIEALLKIPSYFLVKSDLKDEWWAKSIFTIERLSGTMGDMFRNMIYGHKDEDGKYHDNIGAELAAGADDTLSIGVINNHLQTKVKFVSSLLGLVNPELANDLEWSIIRAFDGIWWRSMGMHLAYGPNFGRRVFDTITGNTESKAGPPITWKFISDKFTEHCKNFREALNKFQNNTAGSKKREEGMLKLCEYTDKIASCFMPIVNALNIIGDFGRPIARRLGIEGIPRGTFRMLSVIDKPFFWITNFFRYYIPEKSIHRKENGDADGNSVGYPDLLGAAMLGDILDFGLLAFEGKIKDRSGNLNHIVEIARRVKDSARDIYFSTRRKRAYADHKKQQEKAEANFRAKQEE